MVNSVEHTRNSIFSICHSPQKSSAVQKVYRAGLATEGRPVFVQPLRRCAPAPLVGEPLAKPFTLRGLPRPLLQGEVASRQRWRRGCTKTEPFPCRKVRLAASFPVSFWRSLWYTCSAVHPRYLTGEGVKGLNHLLTILESVVADVMSHYICKWLDRFDKDRKPD